MAGNQTQIILVLITTEPRVDSLAQTSEIIKCKTIIMANLLCVDNQDQNDQP